MSARVARVDRALLAVVEDVGRGVHVRGHAGLALPLLAVARGLAGEHLAVLDLASHLREARVRRGGALTAITTYLTCSILFAYIGLLPDLAMARDRTEGGWQKVFYRTLALGFRGTEGEWRHLTTAMNIFAFAIIPVMFSVHTIVSWDFAASLLPGWHTTIFAPYFVAGAIFSGFGMVLSLLVPARSWVARTASVWPGSEGVGAASAAPLPSASAGHKSTPPGQSSGCEPSL